MSEIMKRLQMQEEERNKAGRDKSKKIKERITDWLNDNVNVPLAEKGYPNVGAGISAVADTAADLTIPNNIDDPYEMSPAGGIVRGGEKVLKGFKILKLTNAKNAEDAARQLSKSGKSTKGEIVDTVRNENNEAVDLVNDIQKLKTTKADKIENPNMTVSGSGGQKQFLIDKIEKPNPRAKKEIEQVMDKLGTDPKLRKQILEE